MAGVRCRLGGLKQVLLQQACDEALALFAADDSAEQRAEHGRWIMQPQVGLQAIEVLTFTDGLQIGLGWQRSLLGANLVGQL